MKVKISQLTDNQLDNFCEDAIENDIASLIICLGSRNLVQHNNFYSSLKKQNPKAQIAICSTAGEIYDGGVTNDTICLIYFYFKYTTIQTRAINHQDFNNSYEAGFNLLNGLPKENLAYVLVLSDGSMVNGSELVKGLNKAVDNKILITGGLAGDGTKFESTLVGLNMPPSEGNIVAIGFYGDKLTVTHGSVGGWESFGPERTVTKSHENVLEEIDYKLALEAYKKYLGPDAEGLPGTALLFPLSVTLPGTNQPIVRTILSIDDEKNTMTFAGDIPVGSKVKLMKSDVEKLTIAASKAMSQSLLQNKHPDFSLLISCVGRKIVLDNRVDEEVDAVLNVLKKQTPVAGFYSYGEISPFNEGGSCQLHNQTMTITSFYELP